MPPVNRNFVQKGGPSGRLFFFRSRPMSVRRDLQNRLFELMEPTVVDLGCELVAVEMTTVEAVYQTNISYLD